MVEYRKESLPRKSTASKIIVAYSRGVTNMTEGVEYTAFGRDKEVLKFDQTLKMTAQSSGRMDVYVGPYGVGKSFMAALFQNLAVRKGFVVMSADITRNNWFAGTKYDKQGLNLYRELIKNTAIKGKASNAFDTILSRWYDDLCKVTDGSLQSVLSEFDRRTSDCKDLHMYDSIRGAIHTRFREFNLNADHSEAMGFFMADLSKKKDAELVGARDYIRESAWFDVLNTWSHLFVKAGYKGLIVLVDQVDYLLNLPKNSRQQNYEFLLSMWNSVNEGRTEYLSVCLFAADRLIDDDRKGTPMYEALDARFKSATRVEPLSPEQLVGLLCKLRDIHEIAYGWESGLTDNDVKEFVANDVVGNKMTDDLVRPVSRGWVNLLDDLYVASRINASNSTDPSDVLSSYGSYLQNAFDQEEEMGKNEEAKFNEEASELAEEDKKEDKNGGTSTQTRYVDD